MMLKLLEIKEFIKRIGDKHGIYVKMFVKLVAAFVVFTLFNTGLGYNTKLNNAVITVVLSVISALAPGAVFAILVCIVSLIHVYSVSLILAAVMGVLYIIVYLLYIRFSPVQIFTIIAMPFLYLLNIPYVLPLICGIFMTPLTIISGSIGVIIYYLFVAIENARGISEGVSIANTVNFFGILLNNMKGNSFMIFSVCVFAIVIPVTYFIRRAKFKYASYAAVVTGVVIMLIAFIPANSLIENAASIGSVICGVLISGAIVYIAQFFRMTLDYSGTKNIQFEDDEYYYYVKAVPKLSVAAPEKQVKRINAQIPTSNTMNLKETIEKLSQESENAEKTSTEDEL